MRRPDVALFVHSFAGGGAERVAVQLANEFARRGFAVDMVVQWAVGPYAEDLVTSVNVIELKCRFRYLPFALRRYIRGVEPHALLSVMTSYNVLASLARPRGLPRKVVVSEHNPPLMARNEMFWWERSLLSLAPRAYKRADCVVAVSTGVAEELMQIGVASSRIRTIGNPVDIPRIRTAAAETPAHRFFAEDVPVLVSVGRLHPAKDYGTLIRAVDVLRERRDFRLIIIGEGDEREPLQQMVHDLRLSSIIDLCGFQRSPWSWMAHSDLFVLASRYEGWGNVIVEALALGLPVVSTDAPTGPREILEGGRLGRLVAVGDSEALADAIDEALDEEVDPGLLRRRAEEWAVERIATQYLDVLGLAHGVPGR